MSRAMPIMRTFASDKRNLALALLSCLGLLAGCTNPPVAAQPSGQTPLPQTASLVSSAPSDQTGTSIRVAEPVITFEKTLHDFGEVGVQSTNVCEFRFKNTGTATLKVRKKIDSTCGCTAPVLSRTEYAPGEEGVIQVTYAAGAGTGRITKRIVVHSNDKCDGGQVDLSIKATVVERVAYEPRRLHLRLKGPDADCPSITVRSLDHRTFSVTGISSSSGAIKADFDPSVEGTEFTLAPRLDREKLQKYPAGNLILTLTHPECKAVRIAYQALPEFQFSPPTLTLFNAEPNRPALREVWLSSNYGEDFEIASCTSRGNLAEVVAQEKIVSQDRTSFRYRLRLSINPPAQLGTRRASGDILAVHLTNGRTLELPCHVFYGGWRDSRPSVRVSGH